MGMNDDEFSAGTTRPQLNLIYLLDTSGSMSGEPINQLNLAMEESLRVAEEAALEKEVQLLLRVVEFNSSASWIYGDTENGVEHIEWNPLYANGGTDTATAIDMATGVMHRKYLGERNYRPVVILITDGESNDYQETIAASERLKNSLKSSSNPNKDKVTRIALGVTGANRAELEAFASRGTIEWPDGRIEENVPLVFDVADVDMLKGLLKGVTMSSIASSIGGGVAGDEDDAPVISPDYDDSPDDDWEA